MTLAHGISLRAVLIAAALAAAVSLSGGARSEAPPISVEIPAPFGEKQPARPAARPLGQAAPKWARRMYSRSLLVLQRLTDPATGALVAGDREGWRYVWPRDAAAGALALAAAGDEEEARRAVGFLLRVDLDAAARFDPDGSPVPGRPAAGDARGWVAAAARALAVKPPSTGEWRERHDYGENVKGDLLANAIAAGAPAAAIAERFSSRRGLIREPGGTALDSGAAWAVVPFAIPGLRRAARETLLALTAGTSRFGIPPTEDWTQGEAWTAPTAWSAWALARLGEIPAADRLLAVLRRAATPAGTLPERVSTRDGRPLSVTPLAWSHAFAILALLERYPGR